MQNRSRFPLSLVLAFMFIAGVSLPTAASRTHLVQPGDTVFRIAQWYGACPETSPHIIN